MGLFRKSYCPCGSGRERGFCSACSHGNKPSQRVSTGVVTGRGRRVPVRQVDFRTTAQKTRRGQP